jgi:hypothetical protein
VTKQAGITNRASSYSLCPERLLDPAHPAQYAQALDQSFVAGGEQALTTLLGVQRRLGEAAAAWAQLGREPAYLASGGWLSQYEALGASGALTLTPDEQAFLSFSPDGSQILTGSFDGTVRLWHTDLQEVLRLAYARSRAT